MNEVENYKKQQLVKSFEDFDIQYLEDYDLYNSDQLRCIIEGYDNGLYTKIYSPSITAKDLASINRIMIENKLNVISLYKIGYSVPQIVAIESLSTAIKINSGFELKEDMIEKNIPSERIYWLTDLINRCSSINKMIGPTYIKYYLVNVLEKEGFDELFYSYNNENGSVISTHKLALYGYDYRVMRQVRFLGEKKLIAYDTILRILTAIGKKYEDRIIKDFRFIREINILISEILEENSEKLTEININTTVLQIAKKAADWKDIRLINKQINRI